MENALKDLKSGDFVYRPKSEHRNGVSGDQFEVQTAIKLGKEALKGIIF